MRLQIAARLTVSWPDLDLLSEIQTTRRNIIQVDSDFFELSSEQCALFDSPEKWSDHIGKWHYLLWTRDLPPRPLAVRILLWS